VYLAVKKTMNVLGEFTVLKEGRENGAIDLRMIPVGRMPDISDYGEGELMIFDLPLFYGRGVLDYSQSSPLIKFENIYQLDTKTEGGLNIVPSDTTMAFACDVEENDIIGELHIVRKDDGDRTADDSYLRGGYMVVVPFHSDLVNNFGKTYDLGDRIYIGSGSQYWQGAAIVKSFTQVEDGFAIKLENPSGPLRPLSADTPSVVRVARVGYFTTVSGEILPGGYYNESKLSDEGSIVVLTGMESTVVTRMYPDGKFDRDIPDDTYTMEILVLSNDRARILLQVDRTGDTRTTVWSRSRGNLFTRPYMLITDDAGNVSVGEVTFTPGEEVTRLVPGTYAEGQYVYDETSNKVYLCIEDCTVHDVTSISASNAFIEDRIVHYSIPYTENYNAFMPYYGQIAPMEYGERIDYSVDP
jgi:hypothetical protein